MSENPGPEFCHKGAFNNYVDGILPFFDPLPPHLVHVVIEWPLTYFQICNNKVVVEGNLFLNTCLLGA